jgi:hypothetical protein
MKFKIVEKSRVIAETIEFIFEHNGIKYIGRIHDDSSGNTFILLDESENLITSGEVYDTFNNTYFDQWKYLENEEILDTEGGN